VTTNPAVSQAVTPWRVRAASRPALLQRFLAADFARHDVEWLHGLIGRGALGSREYGRWVGDPDRPDTDLARDYAKVQAFFKGLIELAHERRALRAATRDFDKLASLRALLGRRLDRLVDMMSDVRLDFARETYEGGPAEYVDVRRILPMLGRTSVRRLPLALEWVSESLVGELALAMAERLCNARQSGRCPICGEAWITEDARGGRKLCFKDSCAMAWRQQRRKPEPTGASTVRVRRLREQRSRRAR